VNEKTKVGENLFYKGVDKRTVHEARLHQGQVPDQQSGPGPSIPDPQSEISSPPFPFTSGDSLLTLTRTNNMTIAQIVYENERSFGLSEQVIHNKVGPSSTSRALYFIVLPVS
jgi:hypothetical protein